MLHSLYLLFLSAALAAGPSGPEDILKSRDLEKEIRTRCLKRPVLGDKISTNVSEYSWKTQKGFHFEQARFLMNMEGANVNPDCGGERQIVRVLKSPVRGTHILYDSKFYDPPYCDEPVRRLSSPSVYEVLETNDTGPKRNLVVLQLDASTLPCPDSAYFNVRRFLLFDAADGFKLLLDVEADFVVPEIGDRVYYVHIRGTKKVLSASEPFTSGEMPSGLNVRKGKFKITWTPPETPQPSITPPTSHRIALNGIYSKDKDHIYYETADGSGKIEGADVATFQLLSTTGESAYTKDAKRVYFFGEPVPGADAQTFVQLNDRHGKDLKHVFLMKEIVNDADVPSFETPYQSAWYARDKNNVYTSGKKFKLADPDSFSTGEDRSCGKGCRYRMEDKRYRYNHADQVVQEFKTKN